MDAEFTFAATGLLTFAMPAIFGGWYDSRGIIISLEIMAV
jgi:hypothetical protein